MRSLAPITPLRDAFALSPSTTARHCLLALGLMAWMTVMTGCEADTSACCRADGECAEGAVCREGHCTPKCQDDSQCYGGQTCLAGACVFVGRPVSQCGFDFVGDPLPEPDSTEPEGTEPDPQPVLLEPDAPEPEGVEPGVIVEPDAPEPDSPEPETFEPEGNEPEPFEPEPFEPDIMPEPDGNEPEPEPEGCVDGLEPNQNRDNASTIEYGVDYPLAICGENDRDFFVFELEQNATINIRIDFSDDVGDLDMALFRSGNQGAVATSNSTQDFEEITYEATSSGAYFLRIVGFGGQDGPYNLLVNLFDGPVCAEDNFEPNDDFFEASFLFTSQNIDANFCGEGEVDIYTTVLSPQTRLFAQMFSLDGDGTYDLSLFDENFNFLASSFPGPGFAEVSFDFEDATQVYLIAESLSGGPFPDDYQLVLFEEPISNSCGVDDFEPNDTFNQAPNLGLNEPIGASICELDIDFLRYTPTSADVRVTFIGEPGREAVINVLDRNQNSIAEYFGSFIFDDLSLDEPGDITFQIELAPQGDDEDVFYQLIVDAL